MAKKFTTDEEVINEYYRLCTELGATQKCCDAILDLSEKQPEPWKSILKGLVHELKGDGIGIQNYDNKNEYEQAYKIFNNVQKQIKNKKGLLFLFVERSRIDALALCFTTPVKEIEEMFDRLTDKFKDDKTPAIQAQVARAMLSKSFILWKYAKLAENDGYKEEQRNLFKKSTEEADKIIKTFDTQEYIDNNDIQTTIAKTLRNTANDKNTESVEYKRKSIEAQKKIIAKYGESDDNGLKTQVAQAMFNVAADLHRRKIIADVEKNAISNPTETISAEQVVYRYNQLIKKFKDATIFTIQENVLFSMIQKIVVYEEEEKIDKLIALYSEVIKYYKKHEEAFSKWESAIDIIKSKKTALRKRLSTEKAGRERHKKWNSIKEQIDKLFKFYPDNEKHLKQLVELIRKGQIIPYIGAGLSHFEVSKDIPHFEFEGKCYAYPLWSQFVDKVYEDYLLFGNGKGIMRKRLVDAKPPFKERSCIDKASFLKEQLGQGFFGMEVIDTFSQKKGGVSNRLMRNCKALCFNIVKLQIN